MKIVLLPPLYFPPTAYFSTMRDADLAVIDTEIRHDKRFKQVHRTVVETPHGLSFLTVPVSTPRGSRCPWSQVSVSGHGEWWRVQRLTLETLFGSTPYFAMYRHDIFPYLGPEAVGEPVTDLDVRLIVALRQLSDITTPLSVTLDPRHALDPANEIVDLRGHDFYSQPDAVSALHTLFCEGKV